MAENFEQNKAHNAELLKEAQFALQQRTEPNIVLMSASDYGLQRKMVERLKEKLPEYQFYDIDLTPFKVVSLHKALQEHLPVEVLNSPPITYCVNVFGLENSRLASEDGRIIDSGMIAQLNYEREIVFRKPNYLTILWGDHDFFVQLQRQAPDFWSWVTYYFEFDQEEEYEEVVLEKEFVPKFPADLPERGEYIRSLEAKLERLPLNDPDKSRTTQERINLYSLLAEEYANYFDYENSKKYYDNLIALYEHLGVSGNISDKILFDYATLNLNFRHFEEALHNYEKVLENISSKNIKTNSGVVLHFIGRVYQEQQAWDQALENYHSALKWHLETGAYQNVGSAYHQIGRVHHEQRAWEKALENYRLGLKWLQETKQYQSIGSVYHQIGMVHQNQGMEEQALENYCLALKWKQDMKQIQSIGITYHQIGRVYQERKNWKQAVKKYRLAIKWYQNTGQKHEMGGTYHQIGIIYQSQQAWKKALENYILAIGWYQKPEQNHDIGKAFHQIGIVYQEQQLWAQALENYHSALNCYKAKTQDQLAGATYHQIGRVYEEQHAFIEALTMFKKALQATPEYLEQEHTLINNSIRRVKNKIAEKVPS